MHLQHATQYFYQHFIFCCLYIQRDYFNYIAGSLSCSPFVSIFASII